MLFAVTFVSALAHSGELLVPPPLFADGRLSTVNTYTAARAQNSKVVGEAFSKLMLLQTANNDILGQMEGPEGSGRPICIKTDLTKGAQDLVNFTTMSRPGGRITIGETALEAEALDFNSFNLKIDIARHGLGWTEKMQRFLAAGASVEESYAEVLSEFFGLQRQNDMFMLWRRYATAANTIRPNDRATTDTLLTADVMNTTLISDTASLLKTRACPPANLTKRKIDKFSADVLGYIILGSDRFLTPLKSNSTYLQSLRDAAVRGNENVIWSGGYAKYDNQAIFHMDVVHEDTRGPLGAPIQPEALLGGATLNNRTVTDATTITVYGGGRSDVSTTHFPFEWFPGNPYSLLGHDAPSADSGVYYLIIYNVTSAGAGGEAGKYGIYRYTGSDNNGNRIILSGLLGGVDSAGNGSAASGTRFASLAGITWDSTKHTNWHPAGSRIVLVNAKAVPYCWGIGMGAMAGLRAYGGPAIKPITEMGDWGMKKGMGFLATYGQGLAKDTQLGVRNYALIEAAYRPQGLANLPTVTS